jgi:hypothetical protein
MPSRATLLRRRTPGVVKMMPEVSEVVFREHGRRVGIIARDSTGKPVLYGRITKAAQIRHHSTERI